MAIRDSLTNSLAMPEYTLVEASCNRPNIMYICIKSSNKISLSLEWLANLLSTEQGQCKKHIIYCRSIKSCAEVFDFFTESLGEKACIGVPGVRTRIFSMFHRMTSTRVKKFIVENFCQLKSTIRLVICTVAFGMGLDAPDIHGVIHWGASRSIEGYY